MGSPREASGVVVEVTYGSPDHSIRVQLTDGPEAGLVFVLTTREGGRPGREQLGRTVKVHYWPDDQFASLVVPSLAATQAHWSTKAVRRLRVTGLAPGLDALTGGVECLFGEWALDNAETPEVVQAVDALKPGERATFGGGAAPVVVVLMLG